MASVYIITLFSMRQRDHFPAAAFKIDTSSFSRELTTRHFYTLVCLLVFS